MRLRELTTLARRLPDIEVSSITADSRNVVPGSLFAALPGTVVDGRNFIPSAVESGAVAILAPPGTKASVPIIESEEPRLTLAQIAMRFHPGQPTHVAGITGTNGKTSVARFAQQLWSSFGLSAGTMGTLGAYAPGYEYVLRHTTPDPVEVHQILSTMAAIGTTHLGMEVSSHGLAQFRADGVRFKYAAFTNITRDHLDYHASFEEYFEAKIRLLTELLPEGATAVINADGQGAQKAIDATRAAGRHVVTVGRAGDDIRLVDLTPTADGMRIKVSVEGRDHEVPLRLMGAFQADNALVAAGLVVASGHDPHETIEKLAELNAAPGRMQLVGERPFAEGPPASVFVDYAHTPDAIETALRAIRPHAAGRLHILFGAGGDRDTEKRPLMAKAAAEGAECVIVTDDNPRSEDPESIRADVLVGAPDAQSIPGRDRAIAMAIEQLQPGDLLLIAGKGHEQGQTIDGVTYPFDDVDVAAKALSEVCG